MINKLINGNVLTGAVGSFFRIFEVFFRIIQLVIKSIKVLLQKFITSKIDSILSRIGKRMVANRARIDSSSIVLTTMQGEYTCNPKYIAEEILRRKLPYKITWVRRGRSLGPYPSEFKFVRDNTVGYFRAIANAKVVIQNGHSMQKNGVQKSKSQYWLQTWHGSLGLKKLEGAGGDSVFYKKMQKLDNAQTDIVFTNSTFENDVFTNTYWPDVQKPMLGHARNDILFDRSRETTSNIRKKILNRLGVADSGQKFLLYAPTHDDKSKGVLLGGVDINGLRDTLSKKFGGNWEILIRTHNSNKKQSDSLLAGLPYYCHNASFYPDMQELLVLADAGITDYSSWVCDYVLTGKPSFLFATNLGIYKKSRGFYHKFEDTPFTVATTNHELLKNIKQFDNKTYEHKIQNFLSACGSIDDGKAASRIVDKIEELMAS